jgi:hypothetical protein
MKKNSTLEKILIKNKNLLKEKIMKKIKNIILALVCSAGLFAATMTTTAPTVKAAEPASEITLYFTCVTICGTTVCSPGKCSNLTLLSWYEGVINWILGC